MKKILSVILALCLMFTVTLTAFAESTPDEITPDLDPVVAQAIDALNAIDAAIDAGDYAAMEAAVESLNSAFDSMTDEQVTQWANEVDETMGIETYINLIGDVLLIENVKFNMDEYVDDKNSANAYWFVDSYDNAKEFEIPVSQMFPEADALYAEAKNNLPDQKIIDIYDAYMVVSEVVWWTEVDRFDEAMEGFEAVLDDFNNLTEAEQQVLADLLYVDSTEEAFDMILTDWIYINVCDTMVQLYEDFRNNPSEDTAAAFADYYEVVFDGSDEDCEYLVEDCIWYFDEDIADVYKEAKAMLGEEVAPDDEDEGTAGGSSTPQEGGVSTKDDTSVKVNTASVQTGAQSAVVVGMSMIILLMGVALFMRKKARQ